VDAWEDEHFARMDAELMVWGRDRLTWCRASGAGPCAVEIAVVTVRSVADVGSVAVRHATVPSGAALLFSAVEWSAFIVGVLGGEFDFSRSGVADG
jgi:hypothetical protein